MKPEKALTNESFSFLSHSRDFLNTLINNLNSYVLLIMLIEDITRWIDSLTTPEA